MSLGNPYALCSGFLGDRGGLPCADATQHDRLLTETYSSQHVCMLEQRATIFRRLTWPQTDSLRVGEDGRRYEMRDVDQSRGVEDFTRVIKI